MCPADMAVLRPACIAGYNLLVVYLVSLALASDHSKQENYDGDYQQCVYDHTGMIAKETDRPGDH
jgi:hypothetical protein